MILPHDAAERLFDALNRFPHLSATDRAQIFELIESVNSQACWGRASSIRLDNPADPLLRPLTLRESCGWNPRPPAFEQILAGLNYAYGIVAP